MKIFRDIIAYTDFYNRVKKKHEKIGFVATMGALHKGHLSLLENAQKETDITICSVFVNPAQFNDPNDYLNYPRVLEDDIKLLEQNNCDVLFAPSEREMYPDNGSDAKKLKLGVMGEVMESKFRPGHFAGVVAIVQRLFNIIKPDRAYFGEKDFQQLAIITKMASDLNYPISIIGCPTIREDDGLAMSSRNLLLSKKERENAAGIYLTLKAGKEKVKYLNVRELKTWIKEKINSYPCLTAQYVEIVDERTLASIRNWPDADKAICCVAVYAGKTRLIDNRVLFTKQHS